jgi:hypothetical protein
MDFSKLGQNEKLAVYGAVAVIVGGVIGYAYGFAILAILAAVAMLAVVFLPQLSAGTALPGSRGSLMLVCGAVAAIILVLALLLYLNIVFFAFGVRDLFFLVAVAGALLTGWAGWQEFQAEGGKFQLGNATTPAASGADRDLSATTRDVPPSNSAPVTTDAPVVDTTDEDRNRI